MVATLVMMAGFAATIKFFWVLIVAGRQSGLVLAGVALCADRRGVNIKLRGNGLLRQTCFLQRVECDTVVPSEAVV